MIEFIQNVLHGFLGSQFNLLSIAEINEVITNTTEWHLLLFRWELISSLIVYFILFYFVIFVLCVIPFRFFKKLINQK